MALAPARYTYAAKDAVLAAGTQTQWRLPADVAWTPLPGVLAIGQVGEKAPTTDQTTLEDTAKRFISGLYEGPDKELKGKFYPDDADQAAFFAAARAGDTVIIMHAWPDDTSAEYEMVLTGYMRDDTQGEQAIGWVVSGKQNGKTTWGTIV